MILKNDAPIEAWPINRSVADLNQTAIRIIETGDQPQQSRLATPAWPNERDKLSGLDQQAEIPERLKACSVNGKRF